MKFDSKTAPAIVGAPSNFHIGAGAQGALLTIEHQGVAVAVLLTPQEAEAQGAALIKAAALSYVMASQQKAAPPAEAQRTEGILNGAGQ